MQISSPSPVLLAEDSDDEALLMQRAWNKVSVPYPLVRVRDGVEAIDYLAGKNEFFDRTANPLPILFLLDLKMPRVNGFDVLQWLAEQPTLQTLTTIVFSSSQAQSDINLAYDLGAKSFLTKPGSFPELLLIISRIQEAWLKNNRSLSG